MSTLKVNAIEKKDADQTLTVKDATLTGATVADMSNFTFPAGHAIQAKEGLLQSQVTTSSNVFTGTGLSVTITPSSSTSKFFVIATTTADNEADGRLIELTLYRDSTNLGGSNGMVQIYGSGARVGTPVTLTKLDSPNTTSSITYEVYWNSNNSNAVYLGSSTQVNSIVAMEIAG